MSNLSAPPTQSVAPSNQRSTTTSTNFQDNSKSPSTETTTTIDVTNSSQNSSKHNENHTSPSSNSINNSDHINPSAKTVIRTNPKHHVPSSSSKTPISTVNAIPSSKHSPSSTNTSSPSISVMTSVPHAYFSSPQPPMYPPHTPSPMTHPLAHPASPYHPHPAQSYQPPPFPPYNPAVAAAAASTHFFPPGHHHHHHHMYPMAQPPWHASSDPFAPPPPPPPHAPFFPWSPAPAPVPSGPLTNPSSLRSHDNSANPKHTDPSNYLPSHPHHHPSLPPPGPHRQPIQQSRSVVSHHPTSIPFYDRTDDRDASTTAAIAAAAAAVARGPQGSAPTQKSRGKNRRGNNNMNNNASNSNVGNTISDSSTNNSQGNNNGSHAPNHGHSGHNNNHRSHNNRANNSSAHTGSTNATNSSGNSNNAAVNEADAEAATAELNKAARNAVDAGDEVTLGLLLTSWANSLEEAQQHPNGSGRQFETVFLGSQALEIVTSGILLKNSAADSPVRQALLSLQSFILYGPDALHIEVADRAVALNEELEKKKDVTEKAKCLQERQTAFSAVSSFLKELATNLQAYKDILPEKKESKQPTEPRSPMPNGNEANSGPAGPDPTKIVERSMDEWRRAIARLQGEMALIVILQNASDEINTLLNPPTGSVFIELDTFYVTVQQKIKECIAEDLEKRTEKLRSENWQQVTEGAEKTVFKAARDRAEMWISQFESSRREIESQLDDAGIGFGPSARVPENKFPVLVSASARVAALVSCHQHAFSWAKETATLLHSMVTAYECLETVGDGNLTAASGLRTKFFNGLKETFISIDSVVNWSFSTLHDKVMGSLEKSTSVMSEEGNTNPPKVRQLRFTVPLETSSKDETSNESGMTPSQGRRKPRHARMKSSPDALLHLNANFNEFPDSEGDDGEIGDERDVEASTNREDELTTGQTESPPVVVEQSATKAVVENTPTVVAKPTEREELPIVYEGKPLENAEEEDHEEDEDDKDIIVHEDVEDSSKPKKVNHSAHIRSMSVDGIPF